MRKPTWIGGFLLIAMAAFAADDPYLMELKRLQDGRDKDIAAATESINAKYNRQLQELQQRATRAGNLDAALAARSAMQSAPTTAAPVDQAPAAAIDWDAIRPDVLYTYSRPAELKAAGGMHDYSDRECKKLTDGVTQFGLSGGAVGWCKQPPGNITFTFPNPIKPSVLRVYVHGGSPAVQVGAPHGIQVKDVQNPRAPSKLIGKLDKIPDENGWLEIPLNTPVPTTRVAVSIDRGGYDWVLLDEAEFR